ncbi:MAG: dephospho-CoA kinase [Flavobacteriales bacterium]
MGRPKVVGLTGGMASGKSLVREMFASLGVPTWDADAAGRALYDQSPELRKRCIDRWGQKVAAGNGINRQAIAQIVFSDAKELNWINQQVHPMVARDFTQWLASRPDGDSYVIRESAILMESGLHLDCDAIILVLAPESQRVRRAMVRDGLSKEQVMLRLQQQWNDRKRKPYADYCISNPDAMGREDLFTSVQNIHDSLMKFLF